MQGLKLPVIILAFVGVLGLAVLGDSLVHGQRVVDPLVEELNALPGVESAIIDGRGDDASVTVHLGEAIDLVTVYPQLVAITERYLTDADEHLRLVDRRNDELEAVNHRMRFIVEEGIATGGFTRMVDTLLQASDEAGIARLDVYIDGDNVYLQLYDGDAYLYEVVSRQRHAQTTQS